MNDKDRELIAQILQGGMRDALAPEGAAVSRVLHRT